MYDVIVTVCPKSPESSECSVPEWRKCWLIEVHRPYSVSTLRLWCAHSISIHLTSLSNVEVACGGEAAGHVQRAGGEGRTTRNEMKVATATERGSMAGAGPVDRWRCSGQFRFRCAAVPYSPQDIHHWPIGWRTARTSTAALGTLARHSYQCRCSRKGRSQVHQPGRKRGVLVREPAKHCNSSAPPPLRVRHQRCMGKRLSHCSQC
jgi:hypothetical protein